MTVAEAFKSNELAGESSMVACLKSITLHSSLVRRLLMDYSQTQINKLLTSDFILQSFANQLIPQVVYTSDPSYSPPAKPAQGKIRKPEEG